MMKILQKREKGKIIICNLGSFYVAIGKDAIILNNLIGLKINCIKPEICKVGFPISSLEKYTNLLVEKRYSFIVYYFDQEKEELYIFESYEGKNKNTLEIENMNCYICSNSTKQYRKPDKYILALSKLYEDELENIDKTTKQEKDKNVRKGNN